MGNLHSQRPFLNRPICTGCNSFMRLTRVEPYLSGRPKDYFIYACAECDQTLELTIDSMERFALHAPAAAPLT